MNKLIFKLFYSGSAFYAVLLLAAVFLAGCGLQAAGNAVKEAPRESANSPEIYFCPEEDCGKVFEKHIKSAVASVHCAFYDIDLEGIIGSLSDKSKTADIKLVMDSSNYKGQVKGNGVRLDSGKQLMHNKFCIIDGSVVITGSFNPTDRDNNYNNNNIVVFYSETLAKNYEDEFGELWNGRFGEGGNVGNPVLYINSIKIENYFCPEDKCASRIVDLIENAKSGIYFMSFSFTHGGIADALAAKDNADIKGIFDSSQSASRFSQFKRLKEFGIDVRKDINKHKMHHKVFVIDNMTVATGSFNPTLSADTKNDENLIIIHDKKIASAFLREFGRLWQ